MIEKPEIKVLPGNWKSHGVFKSPPKFGIVHSMGRIINGKLAPYGIHPKVSCQFFIDVDGKILACVPENEIAWQAGTSFYKGYSDLNRHSIGVEFLVTAATTLARLERKVNDMQNPPFTNEQYVSGAKLYAYLAYKYNWDVDEDIKGHNEVSGIDVRPDPKFDPGESFDMYKLKSMIKLNLQIGKYES